MDKPLPDYIEHIYPDYSIYPQFTGYGESLKKQTAYGFLTRGCPRGCSFCHVAPKEGRCSHQVADINEFWNGQGNICLSDPNILACPERDSLLKELIDTHAKVCFNQGIDARLITPTIAEMLVTLHMKAAHFAMDSMQQIESVSRGLRLYVDAYKSKYGKWDWRNARVFVLTNFDTTHEEDMIRINKIRECECYPYVMVYDKPNAPRVTRRLQRWTNSTALYATFSDFEQYQKAQYKHPLSYYESRNK